MSDTPRPVIITGATGYIGARLVELALAQGRDVTILARSGTAVAGARVVPWSLGEGLPAIPAAGRALIHLAHDWRNQGALNLDGTRALLESARAAGIVRFVFVSSQSAREDAANVYGRVKWRIEQELQGPHEVAARVGLVYGGKMQAQYGLLSKLTKLAPVLPMIDPWREVQPIHLDEVCRGLLLLADGEQTGWVGLAGPVPVRFGTVLKTLARELHGKSLPIVPVPLRFALLACDISAKIPVGPTVDRERVLGLAGTRNMPCAAHLEALGLDVQPIELGLRREHASRRLLLREGRTLLRYIIGHEPGSALIRRYVRALDATGQSGALPISALSRRLPALVRFGEPIGAKSALGGRLALAAALVEADPAGERSLAGTSTARRLTGLLGHVVIDAVAMPVRVVRQVLRR